MEELSRNRIRATIALNCVLGFMFLQGCTDIVQVDLEPAAEQLVVDAWIDNLPRQQTIRLTKSQAYFHSAAARGVEGAEVSVVSSTGGVFTFESQGEGQYIWQPEAGETIGQTGTTYTLMIRLDGERYSAQSEMRRVPEIDSIRIEYRESELGFPDGHYAAVFARDLPGVGDTYWIKAYKNGVFLNKPQELNLAYDAAFDAGGEIDGIIFIPPIRELINRVPDPDSADDSDVPPYAPGDEVRVEIHSVTPDAFMFLQTARDQMTNGDNTIFAIPVANTRGNVARERDGATVLGFFCVSAASEAARVVN